MELIDQLEYLTAMIKEVQRIYAVVGLVPRVTTADAVLSNGVRIPKGVRVTLCFTNLYADYGYRRFRQFAQK